MLYRMVTFLLSGNLTTQAHGKKETPNRPASF